MHETVDSTNLRNELNAEAEIDKDSYYKGQPVRLANKVSNFSGRRLTLSMIV